MVENTSHDENRDDVAALVAGADGVAADEVATGAAAGAGSHGHGGVTRTPEEQKERETRFGWMYLLFWFVVFVILALLAYSCDSDSGDGALVETATATTAAPAAAADLTPVALTMAVDGDKVTLSGAVPDEAARAQLLAMAEARYGAGNVVDNLTIDDGTTLKNGTLTVTGDAIEGDDRPDALIADFGSAFSFTAAGEGVNYRAVERIPFAATGEIAAGSVKLAGEVPDQATLDAIVGAAIGTYGEGNVDASGLTIGENLTAEGGTLIFTGSADAGDARLQQLIGALGDAVPGVNVDGSAVTVDTSADALARSEAALKELLAANPINFAVGSSDIDPASDGILEEAAAAIAAAPGINIEVVGHTDNTGSASGNQSLSQQRAEAVMARLIELGVEAERLTARGAGQAEPIADNDTEEGRAQNRRIAFEFEGATEG